MGNVSTDYRQGGILVGQLGQLAIFVNVEIPRFKHGNFFAKTKFTKEIPCVFPLCFDITIQKLGQLLDCRKAINTHLRLVGIPPFAISEI